MRKHFFLLFSLFLLIFSCEKQQKNTTKTVTKKPKMSVIIEHKKVTPLTKISTKKIKDWSAYHDFATFLNRFKTISPSEALSNALELKVLVKKLKKDKNNVLPSLKTASFRARINTLENEVLRLADMTYIPAIKANEVNNQIDKIFLIYSSVNAKINAIFKQKKLTIVDSFDTITEQLPVKRKVIETLKK